MSDRALTLTETTLAALDRLTEREKDCLRRWLQHTTAKEMAIDLGISPHAVEKRLKMARTKLGVATSLQAARLLAARERYDETGPQQPDLNKPTSRSNSWLTRNVVIGAVLMSLFVAALIVSLGQTEDSALDSPVIPKPGEILVVSWEPFEALDADGSGFLELQEAPQFVLVGGDVTYEGGAEGRIDVSGQYINIIDRTQLRDRFYEETDTDGDGKVSPREYERWSIPRLAKSPALVEE